MKTTCQRLCTFMLLVSLLLLCCAGCDDQPVLVRELTAHALFTDEALTIPIKCREDAVSAVTGTGDLTRFYSELEFSELANHLRSLDEVGEVYAYVRPGYNMCISLYPAGTENDPVKNEYLIRYPGQKTKYGYAYTLGPSRVLLVAGGEDGRPGVLYFPIQYVTDRRLTDEYRAPAMRTGMEYETDRTAREFYDHYVHVGCYDVTMDGEAVTLRGYTVEPDTDRPASSESENATFALTFPIVLTFGERSGQKTVTVACGDGS